MLVGVLLVFISSILARESRSFLMCEGISSDTRKKIIVLAENDAAVVKVSTVLSTYQSPEEVMLMLLVVFKEELHTEDITVAIERIRNLIKK